MFHVAQSGPGYLATRGDMRFISLIAAGVTLVAWAAVHLITKYFEINCTNAPPGPRQVPYLGRVHDLPIRFMWLKLKEWADKYAVNGFYRTEMLGAKFIVVSDERVAEELLVRRAKFNSDRPAVNSLFDSKSTSGTMEYLPLMGRNSKSWPS